MSNTVKHAILDTDFISKAHIAAIDSNHTLADLVMGFSDYRFLCHEMLITELNRHGSRDSQAWLDTHIASGAIRLYTDSDILDMLYAEYGDLYFKFYLNYLKYSCDIYDPYYYGVHFHQLDEMLYEPTTKEDFLARLHQCEEAIGTGQSLGEKKAYLLLQAIRHLKDEPVFMFCSDDFGARQGFSNVAKIPCLSILGVFWLLNRSGFPRNEAYPYFKAFADWKLSIDSSQTSIKIWRFKGTARRENMDQYDVFEGIFNNHFILRKDGDLQIN